MKNNNGKGFTLIELISVIVIIGILVLVAVPGVMGVAQNVKDNMFCTKIRTLEDAAKLYGKDYIDLFDERGYLEVKVSDLVDNNLYKKENDKCVYGSEDNPCVMDPRNDLPLDNVKISIVKRQNRISAYYPLEEEDILLCENKTDAEKYGEYEVELNNQNATYPGKDRVNVLFGHDMPKLSYEDLPRKEYVINLIDDKTGDKKEEVKYTFKGYFRAPNTSSKQYYYSDGSSANYFDLVSNKNMLYAIWEEKTLTLPNRNKNGFIFDGWYSATSGGIKVGNANDTFKPTDYKELIYEDNKIKLYARWIATPVKLNLDNQGASVSGTKSVSAVYGQLLNDITIPEKKYVVTLDAVDGEIDESMVPEDKNNTVNDSYLISMPFNKIEDNSDYKIINTASRYYISEVDLDVNATFGGYYKSINGNGKKYYNEIGKGIEVSDFIDNPSTIYAKWSGGSITLPKSSKDGYTFAGWWTAKDGGSKVGNAGTLYSANSNITLYAHWKAKNSAVILDNQGANVPGTQSIVVAYNQSLPNIVVPQKYYTVECDGNGGIVNTKNPSENAFIDANASFEGYFSRTNGNGKKYYDKNGKGVTTSDFTGNSSTIYAKWGGGSIVLPTATRKDYVFDGWYSSSTYGYKIGDAGDVYSPTKNIKLYARWKSYPVTISGYDLNFRIKRLANPGDKDLYWNISSWYSDYNVKAFKRSNTPPPEGVQQYNIASSNNSVPVYIWFDNGTIWLYTTAPKVYLNPSSDYVFRNFKNMTSIDLSFFDTSKVLDFEMFLNGCSSLTSVDVSHFDTSKVYNMMYMFSGTGLYNLDVSNFDTSNVTKMSQMFSGMKNIKSLDLSNFDTSKVEGMVMLFDGDRSLIDINLKSFDTSNVTSMYGMFAYMDSITDLDIGHFNTSKVTDMSNMFYNSFNLKNFDISHFDTSNVENMTYMFSRMSISKLDLRNFNTSKVKNMSYMFGYDTNLTSLDISSFNTSNVENMNYMFYQTPLSVLDVGHFDTSNVTSMSSMFAEMRNLKRLDLKNFNTSNVTSMSSMFELMTSLEYLDVSSFDTSKVENMRSMFGYLSSLRVPNDYWDLSNFNTVSCGNYARMFAGLKNVKVLDLSRFESHRTVYGDFMFINTDLTTIYMGENWDCNFYNLGNMFNDSVNLVGEKGTRYQGPEQRYARFDDPENGKPGYFSHLPKNKLS